MSQVPMSQIPVSQVPVSQVPVSQVPVSQVPHAVPSNESILAASRWPIWTGRVLSVLIVLFLLMDSGIKIAALPVVTDGAATVGWTGDPGFWRAMGVLLLAITALYAWPRTAVLGAILLTGYLGGAVATHLRMGDPLFSHTLFGVYLGIVLWGGLWFRDPRVRNLLPLG